MKIFILTIFLFATAQAEEKKVHRQIGKHDHGAAELEITYIDNMVINASIHAPAEAFVGFEHKAVSGGDKKIVREVYKKLSDPKNVFGITDAADCKLNLFAVRGEAFEGVKDVNVEAPVPGRAHEEHAKGHSDVEIEYSLQCFKGIHLKGLKTTLFKNFKKLKSIKATTAIKDLQPTAVLTPSSTAIPGF